MFVGIGVCVWNVAIAGSLCPLGEGDHFSYGCSPVSPPVGARATGGLKPCVVWLLLLQRLFPH